MAYTVSATVDSASEEVRTAIGESAENTSPALSGFPPFPGPPALPLASLVVGLVTGATGMCANAVVLVVLVHAHRHFGGRHVNTLISNQSAIDLVACTCLTVSFGLSFPGAPQNYLVLGEFGNNLVCFLFRNRVLAIVCMNAGKIGLVAAIEGGILCIM